MAASTRAEVSKFVYLSTTDVYGFLWPSCLRIRAALTAWVCLFRQQNRGRDFAVEPPQASRATITIIRPATVYGPGARYLWPKLSPRYAIVARY
jgi:nucleoside-diphosphate-sugar epimerase